MTDITLRQLRYLVALMDARNFRRAAERAHISQPSLSAQIQELEERLGVQLVERGRNQVIPTSVGAEVAARARTVLRSVQDIADLCKVRSTPLAGVIRLGVLPTLGPYLLPLFLPDLRTRFPHLRLYVREALPHLLRQALEDGDLDALLFPLPLSVDGFSHTPLFLEPLYVAAPKEHAIAGGSTVNRDQLRGEDVLALERGHRLHDQVRELCADVGARLRLDFEGSSLDTLRQMTAMGAGICFLPALYVRSEVRHAPEISIRPLHPNPPRRLIALIWRKSSARAEEYVLVAEIIRAALARAVPEVQVMRKEDPRPNG